MLEFFKKIFHLKAVKFALLFALILAAVAVSRESFLFVEASLSPVNAYPEKVYAGPESAVLWRDFDKVLAQDLSSTAQFNEFSSENSASILFGDEGEVLGDEEETGIGDQPAQGGSASGGESEIGNQKLEGLSQPTQDESVLGGESEEANSFDSAQDGQKSGEIEQGEQDLNVEKFDAVEPPAETPLQDEDVSKFQIYKFSIFKQFKNLKISKLFENSKIENWKLPGLKNAKGEIWNLFSNIIAFIKKDSVFAQIEKAEDLSLTPTDALYFSGFFIPDDFGEKTLKEIALYLSLGARTDLPSARLGLEIFYLDEWRQVGELNILPEMSNADNGGYYQIPIKQAIAPEALADAEWRLIYHNDEQSRGRLALYLDSLWLELGYAEIEPAEEAAVDDGAFDAEQSLADCLKNCEEECRLSDEEVVAEGQPEEKIEADDSGASDQVKKDNGKKEAEKELEEVPAACPGCPDACALQVENEKKQWEEYLAKKAEEDKLKEKDKVEPGDGKIKKNNGYELERLSDKVSFEKDENPFFRFNFRKERGLLGKMGMGLLSLLSDEYDDWEIKADLKNWKDEDGQKPDFKINYIGDGEFELEIDRSALRQFKPGKLNVQISFQDPENSGFAVDFSQDFLWGVLAVNVNKSVYPFSSDEPETAFIQMGVLDDLGHTLCDADLRLEITTPEGVIEYLSTEYGDIRRNPDCAGDTVIQGPDYSADYVLGPSGIYHLRLIALTRNGEREITDQFMVALPDEAITGENKGENIIVPGLAFDVERIAPTRIWPQANYRVTLKIKANEDYAGEVFDYVPASFQIVESPGVFVRESGEEKILSWTVDWEKGHRYSLSYVFDAPDVSPEFFLVGPMRINDSATFPLIPLAEGGALELRQWQIASDAVAGVILAEAIAAQAIIDTAWHEIVAASSSEFSANDQYLVYVNFGLAHNSATGYVYYEMRYGTSTQFAGQVEPVSSLTSGPQAEQIEWFDVMTQPAAPGDISLYVQGQNGHVLNAQIIALNLSDLSPADWKYSSNTVDIAHTASMVARASTTLDQADGIKDWLVMAMEEVQVDGSGANDDYLGEIYDGTSSYMGVQMEAEDANDVVSYVITRPFDDVADNTVFSFRSMSNGAPANDHLGSRIFALNLDIFESHKTYYADINQALVSRPGWQEIGNLNAGSNYAPITDGNQLIFSNWISLPNAADALINDRLQVGGTIYPSGWTWFQGSVAYKESYSTSDQINNAISARVNMTSTGATIDLGANDSATRIADEIAMTVFSEKKAPVLAIYSLEQYHADAAAPIPNGDWTGNSVWLEAVSALDSYSEEDINFYYQLATTSEAFTATTTEPYNACAAGTAYGSCSSKIWKASTTLNWYDDDWTHRLPLVVNASKVPANQTGFTFLATTTNPVLRTVVNGGHMGSSTAADIVITTASGTTTVPYERVVYASTTGEIALWIKGDISSTTNTIFYLYYGNASVSSDNSTTTGAWDASYAGVYHLEEAPANGGTYNDSSAYNNYGTTTDADGDSNPNAAGWLGKAMDLNGDADFITINRIGDQFTGNDMTFSAWVNLPNTYTATRFGAILGINDFAAANVVILSAGDNVAGDSLDNNLVFYDGGSGAFEADSINLVADNNWHWVSYVRSGATGYLYLDGVQEDTHTANYTLAGRRWSIGQEWDGAAAPSDFLEGLVDEVMISTTSRSAAYIQTQYNNLHDSAAFVSFGSATSKNQAVGGFLNIVSIADSSAGYKWQAKVCYDGGACSAWQTFNTIVPNFKVDATDPQAPGGLSLSSRTDRSITLAYGYPAVDDNFSEYKIFYKAGTAGVTESDIEINSADEAALGNRLYEGETVITISGLEPGTDYVFNIWAYDQAGNKAGAQEFSVRTDSPGRANTVRFIGGNYSSDSGTTGQYSNTYYEFPAFNFHLAEDSVSIRNAYLVVEGQLEAFSDLAGAWTGYQLHFDACQEPCTADASTSLSKISQIDTTALMYAETESAHVRVLFDVTQEAQLLSYAGAGAAMEAKIGYRFNQAAAAAYAIGSMRAELIVTYVYDPDSPSITNTVVYPLQISAATGTNPTAVANGCTLNSTCPLFSYDFSAPELASAADRLGQWFRLYDLNDNNAATDVNLYANIQGSDIENPVYILQAANGGDQGNIEGIVFDNVSGFAENTAQQLEVRITTGGTASNHYLLGGEVFTTYTASSSAAEKTRTVALPLGVANNGGTTAASYLATDVYFPENGRTSGQVEIKKAWLRIRSHTNADGLGYFYVRTKTGDNATSTQASYAYNPNLTTPNPLTTIFHILPEADYAELALANGETPKRIGLTVQNSVAAGGISVELLITYSYTNENDGFLTSLMLFGGQMLSDPDGSAGATTSVPNLVFPQADDKKTLLNAGFFGTFLLSDGDGAMAANYTLGLNLATSSPVCANGFQAVNSGFNSTAAYFTDVKAVLSGVDGADYVACFSNSQGGDLADGGAKVNGQLVYTYQFFDPLTVSGQAAQQYEADGFTAIPNGGWITAPDVWLSANAQDISTTSQSLDYYFELIGSGSAFATSSPPASFCDSGTAYDFCSAKIWRDSASTTLVWYDPAWVYRKKITINASQVADTLSDFPILATTTDANLAFTSFGGHAASSTGADIIVTDADGTTLLDFEREYYASTTGQIAFWIKTDLSSTTNKELYIYYGNDSLASDLATTTGVWTNGYLGVWHMRADGTAVIDSAGSNTGTISGATSASGQGCIGTCLDFVEAGSNNWVDVGPMNSIEGLAYVGFEAWFRTDTAADDDMIFARGNGGTNYYPLIFRDEVAGSRTDSLSAVIVPDTTRYIMATNAFNNTNWNQIYIGFNGSVQEIRGWRNGAEDTTQIGLAPSVFPSSPDNLRIGAWQGSLAYGFDGLIDEARISNVERSPAWIQTQYANQRSVASFLSFSSEQAYDNPVIEGRVSVIDLPDSSAGYKWQVKICNEDEICTPWDGFDVAPNFLVDTEAPQDLGDLNLSTTTATTIELDFGSAATDANFDRYRIFYKMGISGVDEADSELVDANLLDRLYGGAATTTISNLEPSTQYVVNIWAYDLAGNKTSATELVVMTGSAAHARANTVRLPAGIFNSIGTSQNSNTNLSFNPFNFRLGENEAIVKNAYLIVEAQINAHSAVEASGYQLAFDVCAEPCTANAWSGTGTAAVNDATVLAYAEGAGNQVRLLLDVTQEADLMSYAGDGAELEAQAGYRFNYAATAASIANARAILVLTYAYNSDESDTYTNTVYYPLDSNDGTDTGSRQAVQADDCLADNNCPLFDYRFTAPEKSIKLSDWLELFAVNSGNDVNDVYVNANIQGVNVNTDSFWHEAAHDNEQGHLPRMLFSGASGFAENTAQVLEIRASSPGAGVYYLLGGEAAETYLASSSAPVKTRTAAFPIGVLSQRQGTASSSAYADVYFPENGDGSGVVNIESAWFRILSSNSTVGSQYIYLDSKVGNLATSSMSAYNFNLGDEIIKPSFTIIHVVASSTYGELETANALDPKRVWLTARGSSANTGGLSAELMLTYTFTSEANGYLASLERFGGQSDIAGNSTDYSPAAIQSIIPELRGTKSMLGGALLSSFLFSDSDTGMPAGWYSMGANLGISAPACQSDNDVYANGFNSFGEFYRNISGVLNSTNNQSYSVCLYADNTPDTNSSGAKMNTALKYVYQWIAPPTEYAQASWRWFANADSVQPGAALAAEKSQVSDIFVGETLRLRVNVGITREPMDINAQSFKLQYGAGTDCTAVSTWSDVGAVGDASAAWIGYNNPAPLDADPISSSLLASSTVAETYEESSPSANNPAEVPVGGYGEWDFALYNRYASSSDYCFRLAKSNGAVLNDYLPGAYPRAGTAPANTRPNQANSLGQSDQSGLSQIANGAWISYGAVLLRAQATDPNLDESLSLYFELIPSASSSLTATSVPASPCPSGTAYSACLSKVWQATSTIGDYRTSAFIGTTTITGLLEASGGYKWQVLACDKDGACSEWAAFNATVPNFRVDLTAPSAPGNLSFNTASSTTITLNLGATTTEANFSRYRIYYYEGTSNVTESDNEHLTDGNLLDILYNGATTTTIINLSAGTEYIFNIWAYDLAGNKASATVPVVGTTTSSYTAPVGNFTAVAQKTDGSGAVDIVIDVDDYDNDNTLRARLFYEAGDTCAFAPGSTYQMTIDETDANVSATYGDPVADNDYAFQVGSSSGWIMTSPGQNFVFFDWLSKTDLPSVNGTYCLGLVVSDGVMQSADSATATRLILLDNIPPSAPGQLASTTKDFSSVTLGFGAESTDSSFSRYEIHYVLGTTSPALIDSSHIDANLNDREYNNATSTRVNGLMANTWYTFNIWAFDSKGNVSSSTPTSVKTNAKPANISADRQIKSDFSTDIPNGSWTDEDRVYLLASALDQDVNENMTFYYEFLANSGIFRTATSVPSNACTSTVAWSACASKIWQATTTAYSLDSDWHSDNWLFRKKLTISASAVVGTQSGFAVLATTTDADLASAARDDGFDIMFTGANGTSTIPYEREYFNGATGQLVAWVKTDVTDATNTEIYMYFGNANLAIDQSSSTAVWGGEYRGVWHFGESVVDESASSSVHLDSTSFGHHASQFGNNELLSYIGYGQEFDGNDYIWIADDNDFDLTSALTIEFWLNGNTSMSSSSLFSKGRDAYSVEISSTSRLSAFVDSQEASSTIAGGWKHVAATYDRGLGGTEELKLYVNGVQVNSRDYSDLINTNGNNIIIGDKFSGRIDEVRLASTSRPAAWLATSYNNLSSVGSFLSFGAKESITTYYQSVLLLDIDDASAGYKWQAMACDDDNDCSGWDSFAAATPHLRIDTTDPTAPGQLSEYTKTSNSITLSFGASTTEANFLEYKIFYSTSSPVTESDILKSSSTNPSLGYKNYNNESTIQISGLQPEVTYYFNIWAYDAVGRKASSTITAVTTSPAQSSPGAIFYSRNSTTLYYRVWDGEDWGGEQSLAGFGTYNIRQVRALRSDDGGKILVLAKTSNATANSQWLATVYSFAANTFSTVTSLGTWVSAANYQQFTACMASLSSKEFVVVRNNNGGDGTLIHSWNQTDGWVSEGAGPNPVAVLNGCELVRRPGTDNYLLLTHDDDNDIGAAYYYGGSTYVDSWTVWTEHSTGAYDIDNYSGEAFFDPADNARGVITFGSDATYNYATAKYFACSANSINYGSSFNSPSLSPDDWGGNYVHGEFSVDPAASAFAYFAGRDDAGQLNVYKTSLSGTSVVWATTTNGDNLSAGGLYAQTNDAQKPFDLEYYKAGAAALLWTSNTNPSVPYYRLLDGESGVLDASDTAIPDAPSDYWVRVRTYNDPNEEDFLAILQNDNVDYAGVFFSGGNNRFYNTADDSGSNQVFTLLATTTGASDRDFENASFAFAAQNAAPLSPSNMSQRKALAGTAIANQGWTNEASTTLQVSVNDNDTAERIKVYFEVVAGTDSFSASTTEPANYCATTTVFSACSSKIWLAGTSTLADYSVTPYTVSFTVASTSDSTIGYKWRAIACDDEGDCSAWTQYNSLVPNFYVDTLAPTAPGALSIVSKNSSSVTLQFGAASVETNFLEYRLYYATSTTPVTWSHSRHSDADLSSRTYGGTTQTTVSGLSSSTLYYFNIWAVDRAGNVATATPEAATTTAALGRIRQKSYRFENDNGANVNANTAAAAADSSLSGLYIGERLAVRFQLENYGGDAVMGRVYKLQYENQTDAAGTWVDVGVSTQISYSLGLSGLNGDALTSSIAAANAFTWTNGAWHENTGLSNAQTLANDYYTELAFMIQTANALASKNYRLRLYDNTAGAVLDAYANYPSFTSTSTDSTRYSKGEKAALPSANADEAYYLDPQGYQYVSADDGDYDQLAVTQYPIMYFAKKHTASTDSITALWNGQSSVSPGTRNAVLQVYSFGSPNQWVTVDTESAALADTDFDLTAYVNANLSDYYGAGSWTFWRVYQLSGAEVLSTDQVRISFSAPTPAATQLHYRWRNDDGDETTATWREIIDQGDPYAPTANLNIGEKVRLRFQVSNPDAGSASNYVYQLQYATSTGDCSALTYWEDVQANATAHWRTASSSYYIGRVATTRQLTALSGYTYVAGTLMEDPTSTSSAVTLAEDRYTELEYAIMPNPTAVSAGTYCFRLTNAGAALSAYPVYPVLTLYGNTNNAPAFSSYPIDNDSASTSPTNAGTDITFNATAGDADGDQYYLAVCKSNSVTAGTDGPPTCTAGHWCISPATASSSEATCTTTSAIAAEESAWYAFACDKVAGFGIAKCSAMSQGADTPENNSPFNVNHRPNFTAIQTLVDNQDPGSTFRISATANDTDIVYANDSVTLYVCATNQANESGCLGATLCSAASSSNPYCDIVDVAPSPASTTNYYAFVYDNHGLASAANPRASSYTIRNSAPNLGTLVLNGGADITLGMMGAGDTPVSVVNSSVVDLNGCSTLVSATAVTYFSNVSGGNACTANDNNCYRQGVPDCIISDCSGPADVSAVITCTANFKYFAIPTADGSSNPNEPYDWRSYINVFDGSNYSATTTSTAVPDLVEVNITMAMDVLEDYIDFGSEIGVGENSGANNATSTVINAGNSPLNTNLSGTNMTDGSGQPTGTINVSNIKWNLSNFNYPPATTTLPLFPANTPVNIYAPRATTTSYSSDQIFWGIGIPYGINISTYNGLNYFEAVIDVSEW